MFHPRGPTFFELARQGLSSTIDGYDLLAPKFDFTPFRTPNLILDAVGPVLGTATTGLDVCCGTGAGAELLTRHTTGEVVGVDLSAGMLEQARINLAGEERVQFVQGDALALPFDGLFELAVSFGAFGHILRPDQPRFVASIHRALEPGGRFVFITGYNPGPAHPVWWLARLYNGVTHVRNALLSPPFHMYYLNFLLPEVRELLEEAGFVVHLHPAADSGRLANAVVVEAIKPAALAQP